MSDNQEFTGFHTERDVPTGDGRIPKAGDPFTKADFDMIMDAVNYRQQKFPEENIVLSLALVMFNIGDRFAPVTCIEQEWKGLKRDIPPGEGVPKCPNGHVLMQGNGLKLGWMEDV